MKKNIFSVLTIGVASTGLLLLSSTAFATGVQGSVGATSVPSLSGSMLVVLSLLLFAVAFRITKQNKVVNKLLISLFGLGMIVSAGSGIKLISDAKAGVLVVNIDSANTFGNNLGTIGGYGALLRNNSGQAITITFTPHGGANPSSCSLTPVTPAASPPSTCDSNIDYLPGTANTIIMPAGQSCLISCDTPIVAG